jgi:hypothetical protein
LKRVLIGTRIAPMPVNPSAATIQSAVFGAQIAMRSPGPMPWARAARENVCTWSSSCA